MKYLAILRGINVGGHRKILMVDLKNLFVQLGFTNIETYIQTGNVIFKAPQKSSETEIGAQIKQAILETYGYDVPVIVRTTSSFLKDIITNPFTLDKNYDIQRLHWTFLEDVPISEWAIQMHSWPVDQDEIHLIANNLFLQCEGKYSQTKLTNQFIEKKLKVSATTRNWKTVLKLKSMCE